MANRKSWLEIDLNNLEEEWFLFPKRFFIVSKELADARNEVQNAEIDLELKKAELKETEAKVGLDIQKDPSKYDLKGKPTVGAISSCSLCARDYKNSQQAYFDAKKEVGKAWNKVNHIQALLNSLDKVKSALENHVRLHGQNYFSTPYIPSTAEGSDYVAKMKKKRARKKKKNN